MPNSPQLKPKLLENQRIYAQRQNAYDTTETHTNNYNHVIPGIQLEQRCLHLEFELHRSEQICGILQLKVSVREKMKTVKS